MRTAIIGDIHGCYDVMIEMLNKLKLKPEDRLIFLGDLVHKGPDSKKVVAYIMCLQKKAPYKVIIVKGNHEERQVRFESWQHQIKFGKRKSNPMKHTEGYDSLELTREQVYFMDQLPHFYQFKQNYNLYTCVHAGIGLHLHSLAKPSNKKAYKQITNSLMRLRWETPTGKMASLGNETIHDIFWAERYDGRFGTVFFGHQAFNQPKPKDFAHAIGLDLGCVHGNYLAAAVVHDNNPIEYITVKNPIKYCEFYTRR